MHFLVNWLIALAALLAAALFMCLRPSRRRGVSAAGRARRFACARLVVQAVTGFWAAALMIARALFGNAALGASAAGFAALTFGALGIATLAGYWCMCAWRLRRPRRLFAGR
ncbi:hypothetical protein EGY19_04715 [Burkholderia multivorans]|uniref:hypothetical protein n=1 Tax=Burkholderia multivorans TaxID=87883 RepID=UPI000277DA1A|nr:hypothetical protein [Burkholderia multivorans]AYY96822.1 hypothetical protein EGY19_04715 [Burkholderia multivorans]EJO54866.1 hypothetical protein BURMUCF2_0962 [Burkholderia multivorans CF2]MBJ9653888.1 hypothetical protein [Burkholderia multivorans]MBU9120479.1 hypothetical protein [Burkholderia multivorans]MBU9474060.1 hypothetical protein [Burkholderia multivorans]